MFIHPARIFLIAGKWKKSQIGRQLKAMDLQRGKLTERQVGVVSLHRQVDLLKHYEGARSKLDCFGTTCRCQWCPV